MGNVFKYSFYLPFEEQVNIFKCKLIFNLGAFSVESMIFSKYVKKFSLVIGNQSAIKLKFGLLGAIVRPRMIINLTLE